MSKARVARDKGANAIAKFREEKHAKKRGLVSRMKQEKQETKLFKERMELQTIKERQRRSEKMRREQKIAKLKAEKARALKLDAGRRDYLKRCEEERNEIRTLEKRLKKLVKKETAMIARLQKIQKFQQVAFYELENAMQRE